MIITNAEKINIFLKARPDAANAIEKWVGVVLSAEWKNHNELKRAYPSADYVGNERYVFNIRGNKYRLIVIIIFILGRADIRFVGTHDEYGRINAKTI